VTSGPKLLGGLGVVALLTAVLTVSACGNTAGGGVSPTPTSKATATTPLLCTSWRIVSSPNGSTYPMSVLTSVGGLSPNAAWAVGVTYAVGNTIGPIDSLIEQWDGSTWHLVANPGHEALNSVAATSPNDVWAVGGQLNYGVGAGTLILRWDGTMWSVVPGVQPADTTFVTLTSVAASSSHDVWAVGRYDVGSAHLLQPFVEHWDGAAWHLVSSALPQAATNGVLSAIARIPGTTQLWAVGGWSKYSVPSLPQPLMERWDGMTWQLVGSPSLPGGALGGSWNGVVALSATNAWAVGAYYVNNPIDLHPLIGH
jgi:hypothetical protein